MATDKPVLHTEEFTQQGTPMADAQGRAAAWCRDHSLSIGTPNGDGDVYILVDSKNLTVIVYSNE